MALGFVLGYMYYSTKNIWVNIVAHFMNNLMALSVLFYTNMHKKTAAGVNDLDPKMPVWSLVISFAVLYGLFIWLKNLSKHNRNRIALNENILLAQSPLLA